MKLLERERRVLGRESDRQGLASVLDSVVEGRNRLLVIEGQAGTGKTVLLAELMRLAGDRGFSVERATGISGPAAPSEDILFPSDLPKLIVADGVESADTLMIARLRDTLCRATGRGVLWALAVRPGRVSDLLNRMDPGPLVGVTRMQLGRLSRRHSIELCAELSKGQPSSELARLVETASGNPLLVTELVRGLVEEGGVEVVDGVARLRSPQLPERVKVAVRGHLSHLSEGSRHALRVAAVLNTVLSPAQLSALAAFLGKPTATLMPLLDEALEAGMLMDGEGALVFTSSLLRQVVAESVPRPMRQALMHEARMHQKNAGDTSDGYSSVNREEVQGEVLELRRGNQATSPGMRMLLSRPLPVHTAVGAKEETASHACQSELTLREIEVLQCVAKAMSNRQIGRNLSITEGTVKRHMRNIFRKLDATSRIDAVNKMGSFIPSESRFCS
ncbi:LuxR C-terminal-related transcriptional regulator [Streptomyces nitrosporeus]|uniref:helix-turn-helix transcriptional regulator n=1 Tax=Streptomyces nitrosporeus TaxID=28894 RepID=UPI003D9DB5EE